MTLNYLRQSLYFFRQHLAMILRIQLPFLLLINLVALLAGQALEAGTSQSRNVLALMTLTNLSLLPIYWGATIFYFASVVADQPIGVAQALKLSLGRWRHLLLTYLLMGAAVFTGLLLFVVPGVYLIVRLAFADYICVLQQKDAVTALRQSWATSAEYFWPLCYGLGTLFVVLTGVELLLELLLSQLALLNPFSRLLLDTSFGILAGLLNVYGFRLYCVQQSEQL